MFALDHSIVISATDLTVALGCEYALLRRVDEVLERAPRLESSDPMRERAAALGDLHEERVLAGYRERLGAGVVEIARVDEWTYAELRRQHDETIAALAAGAPLVAQGGFFDGHFHGRADFLVREGEAEGLPRYAVVDAKLARRAKGTAILQLAAYADQVLRAGVPVAEHTHLHLGNDVVTDHSTHDSLAVLGQVRSRVDELVEQHAGADDRVAWGDPRFTACGWCDYCADAIEAERDVRLVWGLRAGTREAMRAAGLATIDALADSDGPVEGINPAALERYRTQARLQVGQDRAEAAGGAPALAAQVHSLAPLEALPTPDQGDLFFDFEGDPMWVDDNRREWGLEYLFGILEAPDGASPDGRYVTFWAHDRASEKQALLDFLDYLRQRRAAFPGMHVYHYAFYEPATMRKLAARHRLPREEVEEALTAFVDLYETVKRGVHVSQRSYSIKKLEPFYMGEHLRDAEGVTDGGASVVAYAEAVELRDAGDTAGWQERLQALADYNRYDCESTLRLRDWLLELREDAQRASLQAAVAHAAAALGGEPVLELDSLEEPALLPEPERGVRLRDNDVLARRVLTRVREGDDSAATAPPDPALPLLAAALTYHRQEDEPFWKAHRARLGADAPDWFDERDVLDVHSAEAGPWEQGQTGRWRRRLVLEGRLGAGSSIDAGAEVFCVYRAPLPHGMHTRTGQVRATSYAALVSRGRTPAGLDVLELRERLDQDVQPHDSVPMLVTPGAPPRSRTLVDAVSAVARGVLGDAEPIAGAALDLLRRTPPRQRSGSLPAGTGPGTADRSNAIIAALLDSDDSYVAVQGPPGTGKTLLGAGVIARLVREHGWRVGIVAQSHTVVEHMLDRVLDAGVPAELVAKRGGTGGTWRPLSGTGHLDFVAGSESGCVLGGTTWDFANRNRVPAAALDLLVIEEAGQYALANTVAAATATRRLLLLGDPQQLPQVSQGTHSAPVDASALGWLMAGADVLPPELGYFLDRTWRMHPDLCAAISELSYEGLLRSADPAAARHLDGIEPGVHEVLVEHRGNRARSVEEAAEVVDQIVSLLGRTWTDEHGQRPLAQSDVIVVAAYNAQVQEIREHLDASGLTQVRVGTVDRFQGQEAVVVVLSLAASTAADAARGLRFLLDRHRINVALSRGRWAAVIVRSPALVRTMPVYPRELADLAAFIEVSKQAVRVASVG